MHDGVGQGRIAQRCKDLAALALNEATGTQVTVTTIWNQQGSYRGPRWDLDRWGVNFVFTGPDVR